MSDVLDELDRAGEELRARIARQRRELVLLRAEHRTVMAALARVEWKLRLTGRPQRRPAPGSRSSR